MQRSIRPLSAGGLAVAVVLLLTAATAFAQTAPQTQPETPPPPAEAAPPAESVEPVPEGIEITEGTGFRYEARGRRDPFVSLALGVNVLPPDVRPPGLAGMLIQEVSLRGIVKTVDGYIAMIQGTDNKSYFARDGERLYDGNIQSIDDARVVFRQEINDPLRIEKFQTVEKTLHPVEEGKR
jgi:Tfp pilus assembly protein PilP